MAELLHRMLERNARKFADDLAVRYPAADVTLTWRELDRSANAIAHRLIAMGVKHGDRVALLIPNRHTFLQAHFGALKAGAAVVPVNVRLTAGEVEYILQNSGSVALVYDPALKAVAESAGAQSQARSLLSTEEFASLGLSEAAPQVDGHPDDLAEVLYTSGTTGRPKGVLLTHGAVHAAASMMAYEIDIRWRDRSLLLMPLTHSAPLNLLAMGSVYAGAACVIGDFTPQALLEYTQSERTTHFFGAPVAYLLSARSLPIEKYDLSSAKCWVYGGAPMSRDAVQLARAKFPGQLVGVYGLTESGPNGVALHHEEHEGFAGSIGRAGVVNTELRVVNGEGRDVAPGEVGEIIMRTPSAMLGYLGNEAATREVLRDGWIWTGDLASRDDHGYMWIMDRKKDMIITGGVNVYPKEVEDVLGSHPAVADVAVIGKPHPEWGETVTAVVVLKPGESATPDDLLGFARQRLADFKVPRIVQITDTVPRNASGKILKHVLRQSMAQE